MAGSLPGFLSGSAFAPEREDPFEMLTPLASASSGSPSDDMRRDPVDDSSDAVVEVIRCALGTSDFDDYATPSFGTRAPAATSCRTGLPSSSRSAKTPTRPSRP